MPGTLFVVATPIGNLGDLTERARATLAAVEVVAAEDTRRTRALLSHLGIVGRRLVALPADAPDRAVAAVVAELAQEKSVALVTDAGTPVVSDPGTALVRAATAAGARVIPIPGASAVTAAVAVSGLVDGPFLFLGFLPRHGEKRRRALERIVGAPEPVVLFESPRRIAATLTELATRIPGRRAVVARELTKLHEELRRGTVEELASEPPPELGEVTLVIDQVGDSEAAAPAVDVDELLRARLAAGDSARTAAATVAAATGLPRREAYARVLALTAGSARSGR
ncbi:MAG: 16S rRNA (cytidine(1402)-2'-O)-methyltransferase [Deltaproteobacteria bacterium]|nr:16S rRNA (cytidine(1402)-2'-O)-methyltransferase [Deltaproteobacteria bacterium]